MCVGKALTGGYLSLAATLCTPEVARGDLGGEGAVLAHGPTFMGNPLACAVANASIGLLRAGDWRGRGRRGSRPVCGPAWSRCADRPGVADVRVLGAIGVVQLDHEVDVAAATAAAVDARGVAAPVPRPDLHHAAVRRPTTPTVGPRSPRRRSAAAVSGEPDTEEGNLRWRPSEHGCTGPIAERGPLCVGHRPAPRSAGRWGLPDDVAGLERFSPYGGRGTGRSGRGGQAAVGVFRAIRVTRSRRS